MNVTARCQRVRPSVWERQCPEGDDGSLRDAEQERIALRRPRVGHMGGPGFRLRESLDRAGAIGTLPENAEVLLAIGLKRHPLTIGRPDRKTICPPKGEPPDRAGTRKVVHPDDRAFAIFAFKGDPRAVWRKARGLIGAVWKPEGLDDAFPVDQREILPTRRGGDGTRNVNRRSRIEKLTCAAPD